MSILKYSPMVHFFFTWSTVFTSVPSFSMRFCTWSSFLWNMRTLTAHNQTTPTTTKDTPDSDINLRCCEGTRNSHTKEQHQVFFFSFCQRETHFPKKIREGRIRKSFECTLLYYTRTLYMVRWFWLYMAPKRQNAPLWCEFNSHRNHLFIRKTQKKLVTVWGTGFSKRERGVRERDFLLFLGSWDQRWIQRTPDIGWCLANELV